jgi:uncharacterized protein YndB with AHSA1/START domain
MRIFKVFVLALVTVSGLFLIFAFFQSKEVSLSRSVVINAPIDDVFDQVNTIKNRTVWSPWERSDSTTQVSYFDVASGKGAGYSWSAKQLGDGRVEYLESVENQMIEGQIFFTKDKNHPAQELWFFKQQGDGVMVTWELHLDLGYNPFLRVMGRFMEVSVGPSFEKGLANLKQECER